MTALAGPGTQTEDKRHLVLACDSKKEGNSSHDIVFLISIGIRRNGKKIPQILLGWL